MLPLYFLIRSDFVKRFYEGSGRLELGRFIIPSSKVMSIASREIVSCGENEKVRDVLETVIKKFRRLPVLSRPGYFKGFLFATDLLDFLGGGPKHKILVKRKSLNVPVKDIMSTDVPVIDKNQSVAKALEVFKRQRRGAYPVLYRRKLMGIVTEWDFACRIREPTGAKVEELMVRKPIVANEKFSALEIAKMMCRGGFRRLPVVKNKILIGILTPTDLLSHIAKEKLLNRLSLEKAKASEIMKRDVVTIEPDVDVFEAVKLMKEKRVGGLPVAEERELIGIITERDIVDSLM